MGVQRGLRSWDGVNGKLSCTWLWDSGVRWEGTRRGRAWRAGLVQDPRPLSWFPGFICCSRDSDPVVWPQTVTLQSLPELSFELFNLVSKIKILFSFWKLRRAHCMNLVWSIHGHYEQALCSQLLYLLFRIIAERRWLAWSKFAQCKGFWCTLFSRNNRTGFESLLAGLLWAWEGLFSPGCLSSLLAVTVRHTAVLGCVLQGAWLVVCSHFILAHVLGGGVSVSWKCVKSGLRECT